MSLFLGYEKIPESSNPWILSKKEIKDLYSMDWVVTEKMYQISISEIMWLDMELIFVLYVMENGCYVGRGLRYSLKMISFLIIIFCSIDFVIRFFVYFRWYESLWGVY